MIAFSLLGSGYFLVSQMTDYTAVFLALMVMGVGAGFFKPLISGTIARCTDKSNSTLGFGVYYWSINLGAFLFPTFLVYYLKQSIGYDWVLMASAIGTGAMLLPTLFAFREPPMPPEETGKKEEKTSLPQTLANAFEIIYSFCVLLYAWMRRSKGGIAVVSGLVLVSVGYGGWSYLTPAGERYTFAAKVYPYPKGRLVVWGKPNLCRAVPFELQREKSRPEAVLRLHNPDRLEDYADELLDQLNQVAFAGRTSREDLVRFRDEAVVKTILEVEIDPEVPDFEIQRKPGGRIGLQIRDLDTYRSRRAGLIERLQADPRLAAIPQEKLDELARKAGERPFFIVFLGLLLAGGLVILRLAPAYKTSSPRGKAVYLAGTLGALYLLFWLLPGLSPFMRILYSVLSVTLLSLYAIDCEDVSRFKDHFRFLLMVFIYSGFWVLYFQMFDSVLWYVQAYVDPASLNQVVNRAFAALGLEVNWHFDVEHVTSINAATIILLQLLISNMVKNTRALPTMIAGVALGTLGMAVLAVSTGIWVFLIGITIFSIGEMTALPKFISYVGQTAPKPRVAMYMGYLFLYGVFGSGIGAPIGANLYVKFVDEMNQPRTLWLIFAGIGVATIAGLLLYNRFAAGDEEG
jgi:dipeptide/tripeptide permease